MKIGILTFHRAHNYGAVLQAYALQTYLQSLNHTVELIDYRNEELLNVYKWFDFNRFKTRHLNNIYKELKLILPRKKRFKKFDEFINRYLNLSPKEYSLNSYDVIIIGSDQVWNTNLTNGFDNMYWGNFKINNNCKLISYAASMQDEIPNGNISKIKKFLNNFNYISVREDSIAKILGTITNQNISVVIDPTLLLSKNQWKNLCSERIIKKPYLLLYQVRKNNKAPKIAEIIAQKLNLKLIYLSAGIDKNYSNEVIAAGPLDYINLFKYADFVVCTSFHGTVFSIIFNRPFCSVLLNDGKDNRVKSLLNKLNLNERGVENYNDAILNDINWEKVQNSLSILKNNSKKYISQFIDSRL